jgi:hypothetical protein
LGNGFEAEIAFPGEALGDRRRNLLRQSFHAEPKPSCVCLLRHQGRLAPSRLTSTYEKTQRALTSFYVFATPNYGKY